MRNIPWQFPLVRVFTTFIASALASGCASAPASTRLDLMTHAAFFSEEMHTSPALDPQVFVRDANAPAGMGPQNIQHSAGLRNALITDPGDSRIYNALGAALDGFTLASWLNATGWVRIAATEPAGARVTVELDRLRPNGVYSLFENHFDQKPVDFTPLDGTATSNTFTADSRGYARLTVSAPQMLTHDNAVLVVYHSDGVSHGMERGQIGVTAHHQLIARIPIASASH